VIQVLQGSAVTQTVLGGLVVHFLIANFLQRKSAKNYENWLIVNEVIAIIDQKVKFFG